MSEDLRGYTVAQFLARWGEVKALSAKLEGPSLADRLALCERDEPGYIEAMLDELGPTACLQLAYDWDFWGRPKQLAVDELERLGHIFRILLCIGGRGGGKTRPASEWTAKRLTRGAKIVVLAGPTDGEIDQFMIGGLKKRSQGLNGSGLLDVLPPWIRYKFLEDDGIVEFPDLGAEARRHSAQLPEYRGPEPDTIWGDEVLKWRYPRRLLDNLRMALRALGPLKPKMYLTTSPKKLVFLRDLVMDENVVTIHLRTRENRGNVDEDWLRSEERRLRGTAQGAEELDGELGVDEAGALFPLGVIEESRVDEAPPLDLVGVGVDPAASTHRKSDDTGLVAVGRAGDVHTGHGYVLGDRTGRYTPDEWGDAAFDLLEETGGSCFVVERNKFGDLAAANLRAAGARRTTNYERRRKGLPPVADGADDGWRAVERKPTMFLPAGIDLVKLDRGQVARRVHLVEVLALGDKPTRAEPVSTLYQAGRMHHVGRLDMRPGKPGEPAGTGLETEMSEWDPGTGISPNGLDALVHVAVHLFALAEAPKASGREAFRGLRGAIETMQSQQAAAPRRSGGVQDLLGSLLRGHPGTRL